MILFWEVMNVVTWELLFSTEMIRSEILMLLHLPHFLGGHLYFRLDIILVKGFSKHTLNTYFSGIKIDPKHAFLHAVFLICVSCPLQNLSMWPKHTLFSNFARFGTHKQCARVQCLVLKNNPNYVNFFTRMISNFKYKWTPPAHFSPFQLVWHQMKQCVWVILVQLPCDCRGGGIPIETLYGDVPPKWVGFWQKIPKHGSHFWPPNP